MGRRRAALAGRSSSQCQLSRKGADGGRGMSSRCGVCCQWGGRSGENGWRWGRSRGGGGSVCGRCRQWGGCAAEVEAPAEAT
eukprot:6058618-Pleurochrysis_carterae.AAC.4